MEVTGRQRIIYLGVIPVAAAVVGAVATAVASRVVGSADAADAIKAVAIDQSLAPAVKLKMIELINANDRQFYELLRYFVSTGLTVMFLLVGAGFFSRR